MCGPALPRRACGCGAAATALRVLAVAITAQYLHHDHGPLRVFAVAAIPTRFCRQGQKMGQGLVLFSAINSICESALWDISRSVAILGADVDIASTRPLGNMAASAAGNLLAFILLCSRSIRCVHAYHRFYFLLRACTPPLGLSQVLD